MTRSWTRARFGVLLSAAALAGLLAIPAARAGAPLAAATASPPVLNLDVPAVGDLRLGQTERNVARLWGKPRRVVRNGANLSKRFGFLGGTLTVYFRNGRVRIVEVQGTVRTTTGDVSRTSLADFRRRSGGSVFRNCCAVGVRHVRVPTRRAGAVFVATFRSGRLTALALMTDATFRACYVAECA